ncbi:hypothetical protein M3685_13185 [Heyndrickxia oleronia]|uniref:hypothetical protein n=1 Tax=Heyndrickxia oleronia TaxID=38875 RepID=UPI0015D2A487|nr:hypothetical protein [Heyndrickxia oleronia]MCM3454875.1 hypothetical protein [Heyndrickxia oleronia]NYV66561.1 hypothetical protein [Bacillus sp. Gen3]
MKKVPAYKTISLVMILLFSFFSFSHFARAEGIEIPRSDEIKIPFQSEGDTSKKSSIIDKAKIEAKASNVDPEKMMKKSREGSFQLLIIFIFIMAGLFFIGAFFKSARKVAFSVLACGLVGYFFINYTEDVMAVLLYITNKIAELI